jgi:hypothetical protein
VTTRAQFTHDEWDGLVQLPRWVVAAASAAQRDRPYRTKIEVEMGLIASAQGRERGNTFVAEIADETLRIFDDRSVARDIEFTDTGAGITEVLDRVGRVDALLAGRADAVDLVAYRQWLLAITDVVISAVRTGDFLGFGGVLVTEAEHAFRDRLATVLHS